MEILAPLVVFVIGVLASMIRVVREYERGVIFRLGRLIGPKGPGVFILLPVVDKMVKVDLRVVTMDVPRQEMMTRDNVPVTVDAVIYFRVVNPGDAIVRVENFVRATSMYAQTSLRSVIGQHELDDLLARREKVNQQLQQQLDEVTEPWGIKVTAVEVRDVALPESMKRAMARQAEMERERRAKVINAEGELQAAEKLVQAAAQIATQPIALQLRYLQTLTEIASENNSTTLFPIPIDLLRPFLGKDGK
jgi:regulator of protease activity HflC (stomatin/prohibitin superfamily)